MRFVRWALRIFAYLAFTLVILGLMLWVQFPAATVKKRLEAELHKVTPDLSWKIGKVGLSLPVALHLTDVAISVAGKKGNKALVVVDSFALQPDLLEYVKNKSMTARYTAGFLKGKVKGHVILDQNYTTIQYEGAAQGLRVEGLKGLQKEAGRTVSGILSGVFSGKGSLRGPAILECGGNFSLVDGTLAFLEPVLGMKKLDFNRLGSNFNYSTDVLSLVGGTIAAPMLNGEFSGTVKPSKTDIFRSSVQLKGDVNPRSELLTSLGNPSIVKLLKKQLKGGKLPFVINGTIKAPGIVFTGLPVDLNKQLQEGR